MNLHFNLNDFQGLALGQGLEQTSTATAIHSPPESLESLLSPSSRSRRLDEAVFATSSHSENPDVMLCPLETERQDKLIASTGNKKERAALATAIFKG